MNAGRQDGLCHTRLPRISTNPHRPPRSPSHPTNPKGNSIIEVSKAAAQIQQMTNIRKKDLRKFLDGIYVTEKLTVTVEEE